MAATNDITGDALKSRETTQAYRDNYDAIFGKKDKSVLMGEVMNDKVVAKEPQMIQEEK